MRFVQAVPAWRSRLSVGEALVDVAGAALFLLAMVEVEGGRWHGPLLLDVVAGCLISVPLVGSPRWPVRALVLVSVGALLTTVPYGTPQSLALFFAMPLAAGVVTACAERRRWWAFVLLGLVVLIAMLRDPTLTDPYDYLFTYGAVVAGGGVGLLLRDRHGAAQRAIADAEALRAEQAQRVAEAVEQERSRIARDLHDVVAHAVSLIVVQAAAGRAVLDRDPDTARSSFDTIEVTGQRALDELRRLLGFLSGSPGPASAGKFRPGLAALDDLVAQAATAGVECTVRRQGDPTGLPDGVDVAAYRIVQESVTNAVRHGGRRHVTIDLCRDRQSVRLVVLDHGPPSGSSSPGAGRGLVGMRERVAAYGGTLTVGPTSAGWRVDALLPVEPSR